MKFNAIEVEVDVIRLGRKGSLGGENDVTTATAEEAAKQKSWF